MDVEVKAPADLDTLKELIAKRYDSLSGRLQQVADFVTDQPMLVAVEPWRPLPSKQRTPVDLEPIL